MSRPTPMRRDATRPHLKRANKSRVTSRHLPSSLEECPRAPRTCTRLQERIIRNEMHRGRFPRIGSRWKKPSSLNRGLWFKHWKVWHGHTLQSYIAILCEGIASASITSLDDRERFLITKVINIKIQLSLSLFNFHTKIFLMLVENIYAKYYEVFKKCTRQ